MTPARERFWAKVAVGGPDDCWVWRASCFPNGYGQFDHVGAHVFAYAEANGTVPEGLVIDHLCQRRSCVNPAHLEAVPQAVNVRRGYAAPVAVARMRSYSQARTQCKNGHQLTPENTYITPREGWRQCRACKRERKRKAADAH